MTTTSTIKFHRRTSVVQPALRYRILIDGVVVATLAISQVHVVTVTPGRHSIQVKVLWMSSMPLAIDVAAGEEVKVDLWPDSKHFWNEFTKPTTFLRAELANSN